MIFSFLPFIDTLGTLTGVKASSRATPAGAVVQAPLFPSAEKKGTEENSTVAPKQNNMKSQQVTSYTSPQ